MKPGRIALFDILKGIAIIMVCITHFGWERQERIDLLFPFWISMAVPIFMIVTGYLTSASYDKKGYQFYDLYHPKNLIPKLKQYLTPFTTIYLAELLLEYLLHHRLLSFHEVITSYLYGGLGKYGTYYVPVLLQMLVLFPLIYILIRKNKHFILLCFLTNLLYEYMKKDLGINAHDYRLLAFRYIFLISMGCYLYFEAFQFSWKKYLPMLIAGIGYIWLISYTNYHPTIFTRWNTTSMMTAFYIAPIIALLLKYGQQIRIPFLEKIGQASYHIFLMQILYYNYFKTLLPSEYRMAYMLTGVVFSLCSGYLFYLLDQKIAKLFHS